MGDAMTDRPIAAHDDKARCSVGMLPSPGEFVGPWYSWWPGDAQPTFSMLPGFSITAEPDDAALIALMNCTVADLIAWRRAGNHPYVALVHGEPVACGWSAWGRLEIGELDLARLLPAGDRYLWGFVTAEEWRGRGLYPRLIAAIIRHEGVAQRYWIGHEPDNRSSARGIARAGFQRIGKIYRDSRGEFALEVLPGVDDHRATVGASILGAYVFGADAEDGSATVKAARKPR